MNKMCNRCRECKSEDDFSWKNKEKRIRTSMCRKCHNVYAKEHYNKDKQYYFEKNKRQSKEKQARIRQLKEDGVCCDCKKSFPYYQMDYDHLRDKKKCISRMSFSGWKNIEKEIEKCDLVCCMCHRERSFRRLQEKLNGKLAETD